MDEGIHGLVGVGEHDVFVLHLFDDAHAVHQAGRPLRAGRFVNQLGCALASYQVSQAPGISHIQWQAHGIYLVALEAQALAQKALGGIRQRPLAFQAHRGQPPTLFQNPLHVAAEVLVVFVGLLMGVQVGIARHLNYVGMLDRIHLENLVGSHLKGVLQQDESVAAVRGLERDDALAVARHGDDAHDDVGGRLGAGRLALLLGLLLVGLIGFCLVIKAYGDVEGTVFQVGEGMEGVDDLGRHQRQHVSLHMLVKLGQLLRGQLVGIELVDACGLKLVAQAAKVFGGLGCQFAHAGVHRFQLLRGGHARFTVVYRFLGKLQVTQATHAHHEEFL